MPDEKWCLEELLGELLEELKAVKIPENSIIFNEPLDPSLRVLGAANDKVKRVAALLESYAARGDRDESAASASKMAILWGGFYREVFRQFPEMTEIENEHAIFCEGYLVAVDTTPLAQEHSDKEGSTADDLSDLNDILIDLEELLEDDNNDDDLMDELPDMPETPLDPKDFPPESFTNDRLVDPFDPPNNY